MAYSFKCPPIATHCEYCGKELPANRHWKVRYCSASHRVMAAQKRAKDKESSND